MEPRPKRASLHSLPIRAGIGQHHDTHLCRNVWVLWCTLWNTWGHIWQVTDLWTYTWDGSSSESLHNFNIERSIAYICLSLLLLTYHIWLPSFLICYIFHHFYLSFPPQFIFFTLFFPLNLSLFALLPLPSISFPYFSFYFSHRNPAQSI